MVNNAGISLESFGSFPVHETTEEVWDTTMRVNTKSVFLGSKYAISQMLRQPALSNGDRGWIINLSSIFGLVGSRQIGTYPCESVQKLWLRCCLVSYAASKGAVTNMTRAIALDCAEHKIRCNAICPGCECSWFVAVKSADLY